MITSMPLPPELRDMLMDAMKEDLSGRAEREPTLPAQDMQARVLRDHLKMLIGACPFKIGDLVTQKPCPFESFNLADNSLAIVVHVFRQPLFSQDADSRSQGTDMVIFCRLGDQHGHWAMIAVPSWKFEAYTGAVA